MVLKTVPERLKTQFLLTQSKTIWTKIPIHVATSQTRSGQITWFVSFLATFRHGMFPYIEAHVHDIIQIYSSQSHKSQYLAPHFSLRCWVEPFWAWRDCPFSWFVLQLLVSVWAELVLSPCFSPLCPMLQHTHTSKH